MKKLITVVMTAMCMTFAGAMTVNAAEDAGIGDANNDEIIDSADASRILSYYADVSVGMGATTDEKFMAASDVNNDGIIDSADASDVLGYYAYISTTSAAEKPLGIRDYLKIPENKPTVTTKPTAGATTASKTTTTTKSATTTSKTTTTTKSATTTKTTVTTKSPVSVQATKSTATVTTQTSVATTTVFVDISGTVTTLPADTDTETPVTTEIVNCVLAPEGLDPGKEGTIEYIVNTAKLVPHDEIPLYNIKGDNINGGKPYLSRTYYLTDDTKKILNDFAKEHFTEDMTNYDRLAYTWEWLHFNVDYASSWEAYSKISELSFSEACFVYKSGQCIQYNGAFAEMMAYMGYDVYMLEKWNRPNFTVQHFMSEVNIGGVGYNTEVGERSYDSPPYYYWMWLFDSSRQEFFGIEEQSVSEEIKGEE